MPLKRRSARRNSQSAWAYLVAVAGGVLALTSIGAVVYLNMTTTVVDIDKATLCPTSGPSSEMIVLMDLSDPLPEVAQQDVLNEINKLVDHVPKRGLVELRSLDDNVNGGRVLFSKCNPGDGSDLNDLVANPDLEHKKWEQEFDGPLREVLSNSVTSDPSKSSPIMETLQWIALQKFANEMSTTSPQLVVVSDMLQNSGAFSHYKSGFSYPEFKQSNAFRKLESELNGAQVTVFFIGRKETTPTDRDLIEFWEDWFSEFGGRIVRVKRLAGT